MPRSSRPVTVTLGDLQARVESRVASGAYASASEVLRAAMRSLEREEAALETWLRQRVDEAFADGSADIPAHVVFERLRRRNAPKGKARRK